LASVVLVSAVAAALAGCGSTSRGAPPRSTATGGQNVIAAATSCSSSASATSSGPGTKTRTAHRSGSCTFTLPDGRRFRCPTRFGFGPTNQRAIERSKLCTQLATLVIPVSLRAVAARIAATRNCLTARKMSVTGGLVLQGPSPGGGHAAAGELDIGGALIGFYRTAGAAERSEASVRRNASRFNGSVERVGTALVVWLTGPANSLRTAVLACAAR